MNENLYKLYERVGKAFSSSVRLKILDYISDGEKNVIDIASFCGRDIRIISSHLQFLRYTKMAVPRRVGRNIFYRIDSPDVYNQVLSIKALTKKLFPDELEKALTEQ